LTILSGTYSDDNFLKMLVRPFVILSNPAVVWSTITISIPTTWAVVTSFVIAQIFSAPPFLLDTSKIGYLSAGPVIGGTIACIVCGVITDPFTKGLCQKNNGIYEPEFRLLLMLPFFTFSVLGYFLFGNLIENGSSPAVCAFIWGIVTGALQFCLVAAGTYMVDAYRDMSVEVFIIGMVVKNFLFFGFSCESYTFHRCWPQLTSDADFMNNWVTAWRPAKVFDCIGGRCFWQISKIVQTNVILKVFKSESASWRSQCGYSGRNAGHTITHMTSSRSLRINAEVSSAERNMGFVDSSLLMSLLDTFEK
jgi:hypothetical protein